MKFLETTENGLLGESRVKHLLQRVLKDSTADETEATLSASREALTRFAHNVIHQNVANADATLEVRAAFGTRVGMASTNNLSAAGIERAVERACAMAKHLPENPEWPGLPEPQPLAESPIVAYDESVARMCVTPAERALPVAKICAAAEGGRLWASGAFSTEQAEYAVMNSRGLFAYAPSTLADLNFMMERHGGGEEHSSSFGHATGWRLAQIDFDEVRRATMNRALAQNGRAPRRVKGGEYPVVLEPQAVLSLLEALEEDGMGALAVQEDRSWMNGKFGRRVLSPLITITDDAFDPDGFPTAFDCEGVPKQRVPIVVAGAPTSPVYDRLTASREPGRVSTGHAQPYEDEDWDGPLPENLSLAPGEMTVEQMVHATDRGLYVPRFWYVNLTKPGRGGVTGTTRDGVWWIEDGELAYPVRNLRFDVELVKAWGPNNVRGVGREQKTLSGFFGGVHRVPGMALEGFRFIEAGG